MIFKSKKDDLDKITEKIKVLLGKIESASKSTSEHEKLLREVSALISPLSEEQRAKVLERIEDLQKEKILFYQQIENRYRREMEKKAAIIKKLRAANRPIPKMEIFTLKQLKNKVETYSIIRNTLEGFVNEISDVVLLGKTPAEAIRASIGQIQAQAAFAEKTTDMIAEHNDVLDDIVGDIDVDELVGEEEKTTETKEKDEIDKLLKEVDEI